MRHALFASVLALAALGMAGGCLVIAGGGFTASGKRGLWQVFVPVPQAYVMAGILFSMSVIAVLWLLQQTNLRHWLYVLVLAAYACMALLTTRTISLLL